MENKLKQQLRERMLGQLSSEKTEVDVNNAYEVAVEFARYHVEQALKEVLKNVRYRKVENIYEGRVFTHYEVIDSSILNSYPAENIK